MKNHPLNRHCFIHAIALAVAMSSGPLAATAAPLTLRSLGAVGDGRTNDRAAIEVALNGAKGAPVDGEGLTYAVRGSIEVTTSVDFRNAKLVQTMDPPDTRKYFRSSGALKVQPADALRSMVKGLPVLRPDGEGTYADNPVPSAGDLAALLPGIALRTLSIRGTEGKPVAVRLEKISIDRGKNPQSGGRSDGAGIRLDYAGPVQMREVVITGDGKGSGLVVSRCAKVRLERLHIHDMNWAPYAGDDIFERLTADEVRDDFGWNNFPIYEFRAGAKRFVRVRIQEQLVGMFVGLSNDVEILDSKIERLQTKIGDLLYPLQSDGMTIGMVTNIVIRNCDIAKAWEGIDFTGKSGRDFVFENCTVTDTIGWAFKLAHPKQNGRIINCTAVRGGISGFLVGAESENIELKGCRALETGANGYWNKADGSRVMTMSGIRIESKAGLPTPRRIKVEQCSAINKQHPGAIDYGILCQAPRTGREITMAGFTTSGAKIQDIRGFDEAKDKPAAPPVGKDAK
ncbi:MAG: right-handed parallel beta-helix repeat-containing protein [Verrucomicrobia bacterium]|nr:right-handed parallel beta-helix repeat-containing protein [Verrucomicrobiota bacterium]